MRILNAAAIGFCFLSSAALAGAPEGTWLSEDGGTKVRISTCEANKLCATVVWLGRPTDPNTGKLKTDKLNPDPAKRARPLIGLQVAHAMRRADRIPGPDRSTTPTTVTLTRHASRSRAMASQKSKVAFFQCCARGTHGHARTDGAPEE